MLHLRVFGRSAPLGELAEKLDGGGDADQVAICPGARPGYALLTARVSPELADSVLELLTRHGIPDEHITLARLDEIGTVAARPTDPSLIWADVLGQATRYARPFARYLAFMVVAGVIAAFGVIEANGILIVGAMAVAPDTLAIDATCIGLAGRRARLAGGGFTTLVVGLAATCVTAGALTAGLNLLDFLPAGFSVGESALSGLTTVNDATILVALAAGVAGILALETRAKAAVGVAISITTIPATAYLGVAAGVGEAGKVPGALAVLGVNVAMLLAAGTATLLVQRWLTPVDRR